MRLLYKNDRFRKYLMFARAIFFLKIQRKEIIELNLASNNDVTANTIETNKRRVLKKSKLSEQAPHPRAKYFLGIDLEHSASKSNWIIRSLLAIPEIYQNKSKQNILIIGPRNESEIFNFYANGFNIKNITSMDLFSYSPLIEVGDMHNMSYEDNTFDVVYAGWVMAYSENKAKAIRELIRVVKNKKYIAIGWSVSNASNEEIINKRGYMIGSLERYFNVNQIIELFKEYDFEIVFSAPFDKSKQNNQIILVLQINKNSDSSIK